MEVKSFNLTHFHFITFIMKNKVDTVLLFYNQFLIFTPLFVELFVVRPVAEGMAMFFQIPNCLSHILYIKLPTDLLSRL
jgi:hypothetical protein